MPSKSEPEVPSPWGDFLHELDDGLSKPVELHCIGGFVISLLYGLPRPAGYVDYVTAIPRYRMEELEKLAGRESALASKHKVYLQHVAVAAIPENYESRLSEIVPGPVQKAEDLGA